MASTDAKPVPQKNVAYRVTFPILDADGDLVTGATGLDSEISKDGGTFTDCGSEATEIATSSGVYFLDLTNTEMNADTVAIIVKTSSSGAKTTTIVMYPEEAGDIRVNVTQFGSSNGTFSSGRPEVNTTHIAGSAVSTSTAQIGVNVVNNAGSAITAAAGIQEVKVASIAASAITATSIATDAITAAKVADGTIDAATFAAGAINASAIAADAITDAKVASDVTIASVTGSVGSVTGSVGSVAGAVGSVTGNVGGNVSGNVVGTVASVVGNVGGSTASVVGAVGSVTGNLGGNVTGSVGSLATQAKADVNGEVVDALNIDTYAEPGQGAPAATASIAAKLGYLFKAWRNKVTQDGTTYKLFGDDATTVDQKATVTDDATTFTRGEVAGGP